MCIKDSDVPSKAEIDTIKAWADKTSEYSNCTLIQTKGSFAKATNGEKRYIHAAYKHIRENGKNWNKLFVPKK